MQKLDMSTVDGCAIMYRRLKALRLENSMTVRALHLLPAYSAYRKTYALLRQSRQWSRE